MVFSGGYIGEIFDDFCDTRSSWLRPHACARGALCCIWRNVHTGYIFGDPDCWGSGYFYDDSVCVHSEERWDWDEHAGCFFVDSDCVRSEWRLGWDVGKYLIVDALQGPLTASQSRGSDGHGASSAVHSSRGAEAEGVRSVAGTTFPDTPMILLVRGFLDDVRRLMVGDVYIGRGSRQRGLSCSTFGNLFRVAAHGREEAIRLFGEKLSRDRSMLDSLWTLSGARLVCHCRITQSCHAGTVIEAFRRQYPYVFDRSSHSSIPPNSQVLNFLAKLREEPPEDEGSSADEGAPPAGSGWRGVCSPMMIGVGYTSREFCDGQTLASPGR